MEKGKNEGMNEKVIRLCSVQGICLGCFDFLDSHSQDSSVEKEKRIGWLEMPFFSETVEGSVLTVVQDVRSPADGFFPPARPPSPGPCVYLGEACSCWWTGVLSAADAVRLETQVLCSLGCLKINGFSYVSGGNWVFPSKR